MVKKVNERETMMKFIFILKAEDVKIQDSNNIKKVYRKENMEVQCYYQSVDLFNLDLESLHTDKTIICISFQHQHFIKMTHWIEKIRSSGFSGIILLSINPLTFDLSCVPKFLASGGNFVVEQSEWKKNPLVLTANVHCDHVDHWLYNQKYCQDVEVLNEEALNYLFDSILERESFPLKDLTYVYDTLNQRHKKIFIERIKKRIKLSGNGIVQRSKVNFAGEGMITVWNNPEFCCELAAFIAKNTEKKILLIDLNRLNPTVDFYCPPKKRKGTDLDQNLEGIQRLYHKEKYSSEGYDKLCRLSSTSKNLKILYGTNDLKKFEYFTNEALIESIAYYKKRYDLVITNVNNFIYDAYTCLSVLQSELILVPLKNEITTIRDVQRSFYFLYDKQQLDREKVQYLFFDCKENFSNEMRLLSELLNGPIVGWISFCKKRVHHRNIKQAYCTSMTKNILKEYTALARILNI